MLYFAQCTCDSLTNVPTRDLVVNEMCPSTRVQRIPFHARDTFRAVRRADAYLMRLWIAVLTRITSVPQVARNRPEGRLSSSVGGCVDF